MDATMEIAEDLSSIVDQQRDVEALAVFKPDSEWFGSPDSTVLADAISTYVGDGVASPSSSELSQNSVVCIHANLTQLPPSICSSLDGALGENEGAPRRWYESWVEVPQSLYNAARPFTACQPIFFGITGGPGATLRDALDGRCPSSWENEVMDVFGTAKKISCRVHWPGYHNQAGRVNVRDDTHECNPLSKKKLLFNLAKRVKMMLKELSKYYPSGNTQWNYRAVENLIIGELRHVSYGSWQPVLYVKFKDTT